MRNKCTKTFVNQYFQLGLTKVLCFKSFVFIFQINLSNGLCILLNIFFRPCWSSFKVSRKDAFAGVFSPTNKRLFVYTTFFISQIYTNFQIPPKTHLIYMYGFTDGRKISKWGSCGLGSLPK